MKRVVLFLLVVLLSGCAQVFNGNLLSSVDPAPAVNAADLKSKPPADLEAMIKNDPSFFKSLQGNSDALAAVKGVLGPVFLPPAASSSDSASTKASKIDAAQSYIAATTFGTSVAPVVTGAIQQAGNLTNGGTVTTAISALFSGKSTTEIAAEVQNLVDIGTSFHAMQTEASDGTNIDSSTFFGSSNKGDLAQTALVAAAIQAMVADNPGGQSNLVAQLAAGTTPSIKSSPNQTDQLTAALSSANTTTDNPYAYVSASMSFIPH